MFTDGIRDIFLEGAEEYGWLSKRDSNLELEKAKRIAKNLILKGYSVDDVAEATELPIDTVLSIANQQ